MAIYPWTGVTPSEFCGTADFLSANIDIPGVNYSGQCLKSSADYYYGQIHVIPNNVNLGRLLADFNTNIEVFNAYIDESQTLSVINENPPTSETGVDLVPTTQGDPPTQFLPLQSHYYNLQIDDEGPPQANALYTFVFPNESPTLTVSGYRLLIFGFMPQAQFEERFRWLTDMMVATDGSEQYVQVRPEPRREFLYKYVGVDHLQRGRLFNIMSSAMAFDWGVPVWQQSRHPDQAVVSGATVVYVDTTNVEWEVGGGLFIWQNDLNKESAVIDAVYSDRVELLSPLQGGYDTQSYTMPLAICQMPKSQQSNLYQYNATELTILWRAIESPDIPSGSLSDQYKGLDVLHDCPEVPGPLVWTHTGNWEDIDYATGKFYHDNNQQYAKTTRAWSKTFVGDLDEIWEFKQWLYKMAGRRGMFWVPSYTGKIVLSGITSDTATVINIVNTDLAIAYRNTPFVTDIEFEFLDGQIERRDVVLVERLTSDIETITVDSPVGRTLNMDDIRQISLLHKVRMDADTVVFQWSWTEECNVAFATREVIQ